MMKAKLVAALASAIALAAASPAAATVLPVGTWQFNEPSGTVAHDVSGHGNDGSLQGAAQRDHGRFAGALSFDGNAEAVQVPDALILESSAVTVSAWVNGASSPGDFRYIVAKGASGNPPA
jgi:hypothetical protein